MNVENLPDWAKFNKAENMIEVDPDVVYPLYLEKLGWDKGILTQNRLECARRCFTEDLLKITGKGLRLRIIRDVKYRLSNFPAGDPVSWRLEHRRISA